MLPKLFHAHGQFCASHPWEVIVFTLTLTLCVLSLGSTLNTHRICVWSKNCAVNDLNKNADVVIMTITRCVAVLYIYHQFRNLRKLGSKYILGIAGLFTVFSSFVFSSSVINFLQRDLTELNEALPFFLLLIDLSKASLLAQFALTSSNQKEVRDNIARGMSLLGPTITLDTIVETLVIGMGTLAGVKRLEVICCFACLSVIVNYFVFMTFFPACLSLVLELSRDRDDCNPVWQVNTFTRAFSEEETKPNLVVQRVKLIMSAGLLLVHVCSRWPLLTGLQTSSETNAPDIEASYIDEDSTLGRWLRVSPDQIVILVLALILAIKYIFFESHENVMDIISTPISETAFYSSRQDLSSPSQSLSTTSSISNTDKRPQSESKTTQTESLQQTSESISEINCKSQNIRSMDGSSSQTNAVGAVHPSDDEVLTLIRAKRISMYQLEQLVKDGERAVALRRKIVKSQMESMNAVENLPFTGYDYSRVTGVCCENVLGYIPVPVGIAGPLLVNDRSYFIPMATTEGALVASTNRGCRALTRSGGVRCNVIEDKMTRAPVVRFPSASRACEIKEWLEQPENFQRVKESFDSTSRFARLLRVIPQPFGKLFFIRFEAFTGDAMGMNMLSKGAEKALKYIQEIFPDMEIVSLSGNVCTDKKPAAINWIRGRGKSIVCEATIPAQIMRDVLKTATPALVSLNESKCLIGSAVAGSLGGFNAQAANIVAAIFIATGQDPAQTVSSSNCMTITECCGQSNEDLYISCVMPSVEVGTVGGGTGLSPQAACLEMLGIKGPCKEEPGRHASTLACIIAATVLAGELSLLSALSTGDLVKSHMHHNRAQNSADITSRSSKET